MINESIDQSSDAGRSTQSEVRISTNDTPNRISHLLQAPNKEIPHDLAAFAITKIHEFIESGTKNGIYDSWSHSNGLNAFEVLLRFVPRIVNVMYDGNSPYAKAQNDLLKMLGEEFTAKGFDRLHFAKYLYGNADDIENIYKNVLLSSRGRELIGLLVSAPSES